MPNRFKRDFGAIDAHKDDNFENHFIEVQSLEKIIDDDSDIIYGLKGSGKTALCRALTEIHQNKYHTTKVIDLDNISFSQIHAALEKFRITSNKEVVKLASNTWRNVLLLYALEAISEKELANSPLRRKIEILLTKGHYLSPKTNNRLIAFIQNLLTRVKNIGLAEPENNKFAKVDTLHLAISKLSEYALKIFTKRFNAIYVAVHQQEMAGENNDNFKLARLEPSETKLGDNKIVGRDYQVTLGLFNPIKYGLQSYLGYNTKEFGDHFRTLHVIKHRNGIPNITKALWFEGVGNRFEELPAADKKADIIEFIKKKKDGP